jgi:hypothetical protein
LVQPGGKGNSPKEKDSLVLQPATVLLVVIVVEVVVVTVVFVFVVLVASAVAVLPFVIVALLDDALLSGIMRLIVATITRMARKWRNSYYFLQE